MTDSYLTISTMLMLGLAINCSGRSAARPGHEPRVGSTHSLGNAEAKLAEVGAPSPVDRTTDGGIQDGLDAGLQLKAPQTAQADASSQSERVRFTATVLRENEKRNASLRKVVVAVDPRYHIPLRIESIESKVLPFAPGDKVLLLFHSPARVFCLSGKGPVAGRRYTFSLGVVTRPGGEKAFYTLREE